MRNFQLQSLEVEAFDKARQEMLRCFAALCPNAAVAQEEIEATKAAMDFLLAVERMEEQA